MDYFADLGARIEARWAAIDRDDERFPDLVAEELEQSPPGRHVDVDALADAFLDQTAELSRQLVPVGVFGEPGITQYYGHGFVIDLYFWNNALPAIHNHPFCGCFAILRGFSLQDRYDFEISRSLGPRVLIGALEPAQVSLLREGAVVPFSLHRYPLIHSLVHVPNPSVSMVVRTLRTLDYFRYLPPTVALAMAEPDDLTARQLALLEWMRRAGDTRYAECAGRLIASSDFETALRMISAACGDPVVATLVDAARERHGEIADGIVPAVGAAVRLQQDNDFREQFPTGDARTIVSVLMCSHNRSDVFSLLAELFPDRDAASLLRGLDVFDESDTVSRAAFERLIDGEDPDEGWRDTIFRSLMS